MPRRPIPLAASMTARPHGPIGPAAASSAAGVLPVVGDGVLPSLSSAIAGDVQAVVQRGGHRARCAAASMPLDVTCPAGQVTRWRSASRATSRSIAPRLRIAFRRLRRPHQAAKLGVRVPFAPLRRALLPPLHPAFRKLPFPQCFRHLFRSCRGSFLKNYGTSTV